MERPRPSPRWAPAYNSSTFPIQNVKPSFLDWKSRRGVDGKVDAAWAGGSEAGARGADRDRDEQKPAPRRPETAENCVACSASAVPPDVSGKRETCGWGRKKCVRTTGRSGQPLALAAGFGRRGTSGGAPRRHAGGGRARDGTGIVNRPGRAKDGGPACATVPLLSGWTRVSS